jgi:benzodiazapine receptor
MNVMRSALRLLSCLVLCFAVAALGAWVTRPQIPTWYATLVKPSWTPPAWLFPVVWNVLYLLMALSLWRLWERAREHVAGAESAIWLFMAQLALNAAWSPTFFGLHAIRSGLAIIVALAIVLVVTIGAAFRVDRLAAWMLVPYLGWIVYASSLNAAIAILN